MGERLRQREIKGTGLETVANSNHHGELKTKQVRRAIQSSLGTSKMFLDSLPHSSANLKKIGGTCLQGTSTVSLREVVRVIVGYTVADSRESGRRGVGGSLAMALSVIQRLVGGGVLCVCVCVWTERRKCAM